MKNFLVNLSVVTAMAGAASYFATLQFPQLDSSLATYVCIYFFIVTAVSHYVIIRSSQSPGPQTKPSPNQFVTRYMLATVSKFFLSMAILIAYVLIRSAFAVPFIILFASCYFLFTAFEVVSLMQYFRGKK